jgi:hypothetical protein
MRVEDEDYLAAAQQRFGEQVSEAVDTVKDYAAETAVAAREKIGAYAESARESVEGYASSAAEEAAESIEHAREAAAQFSDRAVDAAHRATSQVGRAVRDGGVRDQLLLGVAGLAVVTALGIAYQRRTSDDLSAWE